MIFGFVTELLICLLLCYTKGINLVFGTRDLIFVHFGVSGLAFCIIEVVWDEIRKYLIRNVSNITI